MSKMSDGGWWWANQLQTLSQGPLLTFYKLIQEFPRTWERTLSLTKTSNITLNCGPVVLWLYIWNSPALDCTWIETREFMVQWLWLGCLSSDCDDDISNPFITKQPLESLFRPTCIFRIPRSGTGPCWCHRTACTRRRSGQSRTPCHSHPRHTPWSRPVWGHTPRTPPPWPVSDLSCGRTLNRHGRTCDKCFDLFNIDGWMKKTECWPTAFKTHLQL